MYTPEMDTLTGDELDDMALQQVTGGVDFVPAPGSRLPEFGSKPLHRMTPIPEETTGAPKPKVGGGGAGYIVGAIVYGATHHN